MNLSLSLSLSLSYTHTHTHFCIYFKTTVCLCALVLLIYSVILSFRYKGGPVLPRKMISQGVFNKKQFNVEVYPLRLKLIDSRDDSESTIRISKKVLSFSSCFYLSVSKNLSWFCSTSFYFHEISFLSYIKKYWCV
jgi:hypothetical protein